MLDIRAGRCMSADGVAEQRNERIRHKGRGCEVVYICFAGESSKVVYLQDTCAFQSEVGLARGVATCIKPGWGPAA